MQYHYYKMKSNFFKNLSGLIKNIPLLSIVNYPFSITFLISFLILHSTFLINSNAQNSLDKLTYNYNANNNQLNYIYDEVDAVTSDVDLDTQTENNYAYNAIGQLTKD